MVQAGLSGGNQVVAEWSGVTGVTGRPMFLEPVSTSERLAPFDGSDEPLAPEPEFLGAIWPPRPVVRGLLLFRSAQVLEEILNKEQHLINVKVFNFGTSAYSVKQMAATLRHPMLALPPDLVVMAVIPADFNLSRTPLTNAAGYLIDPKLLFLSNSTLQEILRSIRLMNVFRDVGRMWVWPSLPITEHLANGEIPESYSYVQLFKETANRKGLPHLILLLPRMAANSWEHLPEQLKKDGITYLDLSPLSQKFTGDYYYASRFDSHPSGAVHHRNGESLADYVQHLPGFSH